jgi:ribonuclease HI
MSNSELDAEVATWPAQLRSKLESISVTVEYIDLYTKAGNRTTALLADMAKKISDLHGLVNTLEAHLLGVAANSAIEDNPLPDAGETTPAPTPVIDDTVAAASIYRAYCDGACSGNPGPGGWGFVILKDGEHFGEGSGGTYQTTNNKMEITAAISCLDYLLLLPGVDQASNITVVSDSQYVVNGITEWILKWEKNGYRGAKGAVENVDLWKTLRANSLQFPNLKWTWVKAHTTGNSPDVIWNRHADALATKATAIARAMLP